MMEKNKYEIQYENLKLLDIKMYDDLFPQNIRVHASLLISKNSLQSFRKIEKNTYEAIAPGTYDYVVRVLVDDDFSLKNCSCECAYYNNTDHHCKHVYALLNKIFVEQNNIVIQKKYDENILLFGQELNKLNVIIEKNKNEVNDAFLGNWINSIHTQMEENYRYSNGIKLIGMSERDSRTALNRSLSLLDEAKNDIKKIESDLKMYYEKENKDTVIASFTIDDSPMFDALDNYFANLPLNALEEARKQMIENNEDTGIIDKAIKERKRIDDEIKNKQEHSRNNEQQFQPKAKKSVRKTIFDGIFSNLFNNSINSNENDSFDLTPLEKTEIHKGNYDSFQFEEDGLEEDDYYYEDEK